MISYYVNKIKQSNGDHEVHNKSCIYLPNADNRSYLGEFDNCKHAVEEAKKMYNQANGCYYCSTECHTS